MDIDDDFRPPHLWNLLGGSGKELTPQCPLYFGQWEVRDEALWMAVGWVGSRARNTWRVPKSLAYFGGSGPRADMDQAHVQVVRHEEGEPSKPPHRPSFQSP